MSDYTSKSELIDSIVKNVVITTEEGLDLRNEIIELIKNQPTVDEKEIIRKPMERIVERLEEEKDFFKYDELDYGIGSYRAFGKSIQVVKEEGGIE